MGNVTFYAGNTLRGLSEHILNKLSADVGRKQVVLVPDRDTLAMEESIAKRFGSTVNIEVLTFARLAVRVLGNAARDCLTPEGCTMLLSKALYQVKDELVFFRNACALNGFANEMYSALVAIRDSGISAENLLAAAEKTGGRMKDKMTDMATIYSRYIQVLGDQLDPTSRLQALVNAIPQSEDVAATEYFVVDFYCFNRMQYNVIESMMQYAKGVHVGFIGEDVGKSNRRIYPADLREELVKYAKNSGLFVNTERVYEPLSPIKAVLENDLFGYETTPAPIVQPFRLFRSPDATAEIREVCAEICKLVREKGYRYRDIAIVCAEADAYDDVLRAVFAEYGIPYFRDTKVTLSDEPVVRFLLDGLEAKRQRYAFDSVMKVVKNAFFDCSTKEVDYFENYCRKFGIDYSRFGKELTYRDIKEGDQPERAECVRKAFMAAQIDTSACRTVGDFVDAILAFLAAYDIDKKFAVFHAKQEELGFVEGAKRSEQVPKRLRELLTLTKRLLGDELCYDGEEASKAVEERAIEKFLLLLRSSLESVKISLLPQSADCVYVGEAKDSRYDRVKAMFVIGAADGVLPEVPQAGSILSDAFFGAMQARDFVIYPSPKQEGRYAMFYLEQLLLVPEEKLYVSYSVRDQAGNETYPSVLVNSLASLYEKPKIADEAGNEQEAPDVYDGLDHTIAEQIATKKNAYKVMLRARDRMDEDCFAEVRELLDEVGKGVEYDALFRNDEEKIENSAELFFPKGKTSISQLETYFKCPYLHFVKHGLHAKERKEAGLDALDTGNVLHAVLENFFKKIYEDEKGDVTAVRARIDEMKDDEVDTRVDAALDTVLSEPRYESIGASEKKVQIERIRRESHVVVPREVALIRRSKYTPREFEVNFDDERGVYPSIELGGVKLKGKIDRIDRYEDGAAGIEKYYVVDYKTGKISVSLVDAYVGLKVQLYAYLGALRQENEMPVGGFYKQISGAYQKNEEKAPIGSLRGYAPHDEELLREMDSTWNAEWSARAKYFKNTVTGDRTLEEGELDAIIDYVRRVMETAVAEIKTGYIEAKPYEYDDCKYCNAKYMCDNTERDLRESVKVDTTSFRVKL